MSIEKTIKDCDVKKLEESKNAALQRVAARLAEQKGTVSVNASHSSHSSGSGRTHTSYVSS